MGHESKDKMIRIPLMLLVALTLSACVDSKERPADGAVGNTFTLHGTVQIIPNANLSCKVDDPKADCKGNLYWALFDKPITNFAASPPLRAGTVKDAKNGTTFTAAGIPVKPQLYMGAFIDDNSNMVLSSPLPDKGDPVFFSLAGFSVQAGQKFNYSLAFLIRLW
jgi:hypothetical protein